jgi:hypothetical protein
MGIIVEEVTFQGKAPSIAAITEKLTQMLALPVVVNESPPRVTTDMYDLSAHVAFASFPRHQVELTAYRPGAVEAHLQRCGMSDLPHASMVQGANQPPGTQILYLQSYVGQERTLFFATMLALEALAGRPRTPIPADLREKFAAPLTVAELTRRHRKNDRHNLAVLLLGIVMLPIILPIQLASIAWHIIALPKRLRAASRQQHHKSSPPPP